MTLVTIRILYINPLAVHAQFCFGRRFGFQADELGAHCHALPEVAAQGRLGAQGEVVPAERRSAE